MRPPSSTAVPSGSGRLRPGPGRCSLLAIARPHNPGGSSPIPPPRRDRSDPPVLRGGDRRADGPCPARGAGGHDGRVTATAVVTGASSGIGAATVRRLRADGFDVVAAAGGWTGCTRSPTRPARALHLDVTSQASVEAFVNESARAEVLVNNAGGAIGLEPVATADLEAWRTMYEVNVLGAARVTKALLPKLVASGAGHVVVIGSVAGHTVYEGGAGYTAAKHGASVLAETLRLELLGQPVRVTEIAPGMVRTEEFSLNRFHGDQERADAVYDGVDAPLRAEDVAECVAWCVGRPPHVDIDLLVVKPLAQAAPNRVHRSGGSEGSGGSQVSGDAAR